MQNISIILGLKNLKVFLSEENKNLKVILNLDKSALIEKVHLQEIHSLLNWVCGKVEIQSLLITSNQKYFSLGIKNLKEQSSQELLAILGLSRKIIFSMLYLPQTIIFDLKKGAANLGLELSLGADLRICHKQAIMEMDHLKIGLIPSVGGAGLLQNMLGATQTKNWILGAKNMPLAELKSCGFIFECYTQNDLEANKLIKSISDQAPVQRIQAKLALTKNLIHQMQTLSEEDSIIRAAISTEDYKKHPYQFTCPKKLYAHTDIDIKQGPHQ